MKLWGATLPGQMFVTDLAGRRQRRLRCAPLAVIALAVGMTHEAFALDIERRTVTIRTVEYPAVAVDELDFSKLRIEVAWSSAERGEPILLTTNSICMFDGGGRDVNEPIEVATHYYDVPFRSEGGVALIRDGGDAVIHATSLDALESSRPFGFDECRYRRVEALDADLPAGLATVQAEIEESVRDHYRSRAERAATAALFFEVEEVSVPLYDFRDPQHDYADLARAGELAASAYASLQVESDSAPAVRSGLLQAIGIWQAALETADVDDPRARIPRQVAARLHESIGAARLALGEGSAALRELRLASSVAGIETSRSDGTGSTDLLEHAERLTEREAVNGGLRDSTSDVPALIRSTEAWRGRIPIQLVGEPDRPRVTAAYRAWLADAVSVRGVEERNADEIAIATGAVNPYEQFVQRAGVHGFVLLMPSNENLTTFPRELCELTYLNRLRVEKHGFQALPDEIGRLEALTVLNLAGNRIEELPTSIGHLSNLTRLDLSDNRLISLPDEIARLGRLQVLELRGNPLADGEAERIQRLLPRCKIKI